MCRKQAPRCLVTTARIPLVDTVLCVFRLLENRLATVRGNHRITKGDRS